MTPAELRAARKKLKLSAAALGRALQLGGRDPGRSITAWENGDTRIPGPAAVAIRYMLQERGHFEQARRAQEIGLETARKLRDDGIINLFAGSEEQTERAQAASPEKPPQKPRNRRRG